MAAVPAQARYEDGLCARCGVELTRFNRECVHVFLCLGCQHAEESTNDDWPAGVPIVDRAPAGDADLTPDEVEQALEDELQP